MVQLDRLESLPERLTQHEKLFNDMLHLIPAKYYVNKKPEFNNNPYMHNKRKLKAPKQEIKERSKKARKAKLDPENEKSIAEVQAIEAQRKEEEEEEDDDDDDDDESVQDDEEESVKGDFVGLQEEEKKEESKQPEEPVQAMKRTDIADLHNRLQQRIADLRQQRNAPNAKSREEILSQRAKKREDRKKAQAARKEKKGGTKAPTEELVQQQAAKKNAADAVKMDGDLFFGKVSLGQEKKKKGNVDAKQQLEKIEQKKKQLDQLRSEDKQKAAQLEEKDQWDKALALATGEKIKDDTKLLRKTIKNKEQQKKKTSADWNKRVDKVKGEERAKIKKREENIRQHTLGKKNGDNKKNKKKNGKGMDKKKKARHGFEGAAFGYGGKVTKSKKK